MLFLFGHCSAPLLPQPHSLLLSLYHWEFLCQVLFLFALFSSLTFSFFPPLLNKSVMFH